MSQNTKYNWPVTQIQRHQDVGEKTAPPMWWIMENRKVKRPYQYERGIQMGQEQCPKTTAGVIQWYQWFSQVRRMQNDLQRIGTEKLHPINQHWNGRIRNHNLDGNMWKHPLDKAYWSPWEWKYSQVLNLKTARPIQTGEGRSSDKINDGLEELLSGKEQQT